MNASLNAVVGDISKKIKEQEEERLAQDAENSSLRSDLQVILMYRYFFMVYRSYYSVTGLANRTYPDRNGCRGNVMFPLVGYLEY